MHMHRCGVPAHKAGGVWVLMAGLGLAAIAGTERASAQTPPAVAGTAAPSEAVQRQANSPYRFILQNANAPSRAKPPPGRVPAGFDGRNSARIQANKAARTLPVPTSRPR